jgi:ketosteroid isomerase-like protein
MSQENVEQAHRIAAAINRHDIDGVLALTDPDAEFIPRLVEVDGGGSYRGHDGVRNWWENLFGVWPDFKAEIEEMRDLGDVTVARVRISGQGIASGAVTAETAWVVNEWRGGKTIWTRVFQSEAKALEALGLSE